MLMSSRKESPLVILTRALPSAVVAGMVVQVGLIVGGLMIGSLALGLFIDARFATKPLFTLGLAFIALPLSIWLTYRVAMRASARARAQYEAYLESQRAPANQADEARGASSEAFAPLKH
jgi:F0F1-type ATP synthase assembly protein I